MRDSYIGLIGATPGEVNHIRSVLSVEDSFQQSSILFYRGQCEDKKVVLARSGVGKVNAAIAAQLMIQNFKPRALICFGVAGAISSHCDIGDVIVGERLIQHDFGWYTTGQFVPDEIFIYRGKKIESIPWFVSHPALIKTAREVAGQNLLCTKKIRFGIIVSGDQVVCLEEKKKDLALRHRALATDMESAAVAQVAYMNQVPLLVIRAISDKSDLNLERSDLRKKIKLDLKARKEFALAMKEGIAFLHQVLRYINLSHLGCETDPLITARELPLLE